MKQGVEDLICALDDFNSRFPTEESAVEEIYKRLVERGVVRCRHCGFSQFSKSRGSRRASCLSCRKWVWITANTFFHKAKKLRPLLAVIWLMERGFVLSSVMTHRALDVAQSTALMMLKKIRLALVQYMHDRVQIPIDLFLPVVSKRSRETKAGEHPQSELMFESELGKPPVDANDEASELGIAAISAEDAELDGNKAEQQLLSLLSDRPVTVDWIYERTALPLGDVIASLVELELSNKAIRLPGDRYARRASREHRRPSFASDALSAELLQIASSICTFIRQHFRGVSAKHLQEYITEHACANRGIRWTDNSILRLCLDLGRPIMYRQILRYVSPRLIKIGL